MVRMTALNRKIFRDFRSLRSQAITTALLVACGISFLIASWNAYNSLKSARDHYYQEYYFANFFSELKRAPEELVTKLSSINGVEIVEARIVMEGLIDFPQKNNDLLSPWENELSVGHFISIPPGTGPQLNQLYLRKGRLPAEGSEIEVAVHEGFAQANQLNIGDKILVTIKGQRRQLIVVGIAISPEYIYALSPGSPLPDDKHFGIFWVAKRPFEQWVQMVGAFNNVSLKANVISNVHQQAIKNQMENILRPYGNRTVYGRDEQMSHLFLDGEIAEQKTMAIITPAIFLGIAAFLIQIISSRLINMHRPQIAVLKAIGYSNFQVAFHYLKLIFLMIAVGQLPGIALGAGIGKLFAISYERFFRFPDLDFSLSMSSLVIGIFAGTIPGLIGAWTSIMTIFKLEPAEAMRAPSPPKFQLGLFDRLKINAWLGVRERLVVRNLFLRPWKFLLTVLGLSTATAILVMAMAWVDIIDFMLKTQFQRIQREDIGLGFVEPLPSSALQQLSQLKGVLNVEGYRMIPVRLHHKNHKKEVLLTGRPAGAQMRQQLDFQLRTIPPATYGVLLSDYFQKNWGVRPGDTIEIELLEGPKRSVKVQIEGMTQDLIGLSASMDIYSLWKLLGEQPAYNMSTLQTDPLFEIPLQRELKGMPLVATVSLKKSLYQGFLSSMGTLIQVSTMILIFFALVIAIGVIYNSIRVSFSERSWEMASLRVLGFSSNETLRMLLAEVGVQVGLSFIPGCLLGYSITHIIILAAGTESFNFPVVIEAKTYVHAILIMLVAFALSVFFVKSMIQKINLSESLKARD